jgi:hypothetical protein
MPEIISRTIRITGLSSYGGPPLELISLAYVTTEPVGIQQFYGNFVLTKEEVKKHNIFVGDEFELSLSRVDSKESSK